MEEQSSGIAPPPPPSGEAGASATSSSSTEASSPATTSDQMSPPSVRAVIDDEERQDIEELLNALDDFVPAIPDEVVNYYLTKTGFMCSDDKIRRLVSLAAQKFISDIAEDALQYCKIRQQSPAHRDKRAKGQRLVLTMDDLSQALKEYGITVKKPEYFVDRNPPTATGHSTSPSSSAPSGPDKKKKRTK